MKNVNDAKFIKGLVNDQLGREPFTNLISNANISTVHGEHVVDFVVINLTESINELIEDVQYITKHKCIVINNKNYKQVRFF